jgi:periplasmic protein TonB
MFEQLVVSHKMPKTRRRSSVAFAIAIQLLIVAVLIVVPLMFTEALPKTMLTTFLTAPPPPAPPPPPPPAAKQVQRPKLAQVVTTHALVAPTMVPKKIEAVNEPAPTVETNTGDGLPGGTGSTLGSLIGNGPPPPPPPKQSTPQRIHVGGNVEAAKLVDKVTPEYPPIAKSAHISGTVVLHAVISKDGTVQQLKYVSGPALLMTAAMNAVREWRYRPTELNGQPVEVDTTIQVVYSLG